MSTDAEGLDTAFHTSVMPSSETPTFTNAGFVLRHTPRRPAGSRHVNRDMNFPDVLDLGTCEKSPSHQRQARTTRERTSSLESHSSCHLRRMEHKANTSTASQPQVTQAKATKRYRSPISIPDSMSDDESLGTIEVDTTSLSRQTHTKPTAKAVSRLPVRAKRAPKRVKRSPKNDNAPKVSITKLKDIALAASAMLQDDNEAPEMYSSTPSRAATPPPVRQDGRTPRKAAVRANQVVKEICKQYPVVNGKARGRKCTPAE